MPQYVILADHSADICPSSNSKSRVRAVQGLGHELPRLSAEAGSPSSPARSTSIPATAPWPSSRPRASKR